MSMYKTIGTYTPQELLASPVGADPINIACTPGKGVVPMGTVMFRESNGMYSPAAAAQAVGTNQLVILAEEIDTDAHATIAQDAAAYRGGKLIRSKVQLAANAAITAAAELVLRQQGLVLSPMAGEGTFNNDTSAT